MIQRSLQAREVVQPATRPSYGRVFILLAFFTLLEIGASYLPLTIKAPILVILAVTKALLVLLYFMHLKFDSRLFAMPVILGAIVIIPLILMIVLVMPLLR